MTLSRIQNEKSMRVVEYDNGKRYCIILRIKTMITTNTYFFSFLSVRRIWEVGSWTKQTRK